ncbi:MAG: alcohol dehydrogenase catalytic domain-containing protein [Microbacterium sp.]
MRSMKLVGPRTFAEVDSAAPVEDDLEQGQVLLRVLAGGICGTDIPYFRGRMTPYRDGLIPHGPGDGFPLHEVVGEVLAAGHDGFRTGDVVVGWASRYDGLSEVIVAQSDELHRYSSALAPHHAVLIQPLACVLYALEQLSPVADERVSVIGLGSIGSLFAHVLARRGAIVDAVDVVDRRAVVDALGIRSLMTAPATEWAAQIAGGAPRLVIEAVGHQTETLTAAIRAVSDEGEIYAFGIPDDDTYPLPMGEFMRKGAVLRGGFTRDRARVLADADAYLVRHPELADILVSDVFGFTDAQRAFERAELFSPDRLKVVLTRA